MVVTTFGGVHFRQFGLERVDSRGSLPISRVDNPRVTTLPTSSHPCRHAIADCGSGKIPLITVRMWSVRCSGLTGPSGSYH